MIYPFLRGFVSLRSAPVTWLLFAINAVVFISTWSAQGDGQDRLEAMIADSHYVATQGAAFAQMIEREPALFSSSLRDMAGRARKGDLGVQSILGALAFRNAQFMAHAPTYVFEGDEIALEAWRKKIGEVHEIQSAHPSFAWGLSHRNASAKAWLTYQFAHSGFMHFALNMAFLLIFGAFLEARVGSSLVVLGYIASGVCGAFAFTRLTGLTLSPLVGASASVSGLGTLAAVHCWRERVPFFFMIFPQPGYFGFALLPAWTILILMTLPDIAGLWSSVSDVTGVAFAAHLGGAAIGCAMAWALRGGWLMADPYDPEIGWELFEGES